MKHTEQKEAETLPHFLKAAIDSELKRAFDEELEKAKQRLEARKPEIVAGVIIWVYKQMNIETVGNSLVITVRLDNK